MNKYFVYYFFIEHIVSIIASLLKNCIGENKQRILSKFTENDHEKVKFKCINK